MLQYLFSSRLILQRVSWLVPAAMVLILVSSDAPIVRARADAVRLPKVMLWAWERPEDLRWIPRGTGVAFLACTVTMRDGNAVANWRMQPLRVKPSTPVIAVVRIENRGTSLTDELRAQVAKIVDRAARLPRVRGVQIDYDARLSEHTFYVNLLRDVRRQLPPQESLSITALASWCQGDDWLAGLPIDEAVPMLFRLGAESSEFRALARSGQPFREPLCRVSAGLSTDEPLMAPAGTQRVYWFSPRAWTPAIYKQNKIGEQP